MNNEHKTISEKVLERIEHTTPRSRRYFVLRNAGIWALAGAAIFVGALAVASVIFRAVNTGAVIRPGMSPFRLVFLAVPILWALLVGAFGYVAYREIRSTRKGYKYEFSTVLLGTLLASTVLGIAFYVSGAGFVLDRLAVRNLPFKADLEHLQQERWFQPESGFLIGTVRADAGAAVQVTDPEDVVWAVQFTDAVSEKKIESLEEGERVGLRGRALNTKELTFLACDIRSLEFDGRGPLFMRQHAKRMHALGERKMPPERSTECED